MMKNMYPRPQFKREDWVNLNGQWDFGFDDTNIGIEEGWYQDFSKLNKKINVPFVYQSELSGINERVIHDIVWYKRDFSFHKRDDKVVLLHFGAVDYEADVYVNGQHVCHHIGGHTSFKIDITSFLVAGPKQTVVVRAFDQNTDESMPRGKQFWETESRAIWYTNSTGIWQTVWIEELSKTYLDEVRFTPLYDEGKIQIDASLNQYLPGVRLGYEISFKGENIAKGLVDFKTNKLVFDIELFHEHIFRTNFHDAGWSWSPENPNLFDITLSLYENEKPIDRVESYFGFRKIHIEDGMTFLNNKPYYQKLILDQGYWPEGLLTAPTDEDFIKDIKLAKEMGFNGCRKHQKTEDPRFLYWADQLGYLVWGECAAPAVFTTTSVERLIHEWMEIIHRDYSHPCIVTWVPINESWGVPNIHHNRQQQHFSQTMYHFLHSLDTTRLVISNDGWEMTETDICAIHNYAHGQETEKQKYHHFKDTLATKEKILHYASTPWSIYAKGFQYQGEPIMLTEFGGIGFDVSGKLGWGYTSVENEEEFIKDYSRIMKALYASEVLWGYCYTQLTDVEQEINGLLTYDRQPKCDLSKIKAINDGYHLNRI